MARENHTPIRRGKPVFVSFDPDARELLRVLSPNSNGVGLLLSELVRREARERAARPQLLEALLALAAGPQAAAVDPGGGAPRDQT